MGKYLEFSTKALESLGGKDNLVHVTHCATRLRVTYKQTSLTDPEKMKNLPNCMGLVNKDKQVQFVIGPDINDCYNEFIEVAKWDPQHEVGKEVESVEEEGPHNFLYWANKYGNFVAPIFTPIIPALLTGGIILAVRTLLINYAGVSMDSGTAYLLQGIFQAAFNFLPVWVGWTLASQLKMQPIMGAFLGATLICSNYTNGKITDFLGITITQAKYNSSVLPVVLGVFFMYFVDKALKKIVPEAIRFFVKPLLTMLIVVPVEFIVLGPLGTELSGAVATGLVWFANTLGFIAQPILCMVYPYMVMLGLDKGISAIAIQLISEVGYNNVTAIMGFVSNISIGATALAVSTTLKDKTQRGTVASFGITGLCGVTEPAFYGALISRPIALVGTAIGAGCAGLFAGIMGLRGFIQGGCPGWLTLLFFVDPNGSLHYFWIAIITALIATVVSFLATKIVMAKFEKNL